MEASDFIGRCFLAVGENCNQYLLADGNLTKEVSQIRFMDLSDAKTLASMLDFAHDITILMVAGMDREGWKLKKVAR